MQLLAAVVAAVVVGTWNAKWFPSGERDHRAEPAVEARTIAEAGRLLASGLRSVDPLGTNDVIICLNEIRGRKVADALRKAIGRTNLVLAAASAYRLRDRFDPQQDVILTTLPVAQGNWSYWKREKEVWPPRGYAHADLVFEPSVTASVYAVHLKANSSASEAKTAAENRAKRGAAIRQLIAIEKPSRSRGRISATCALDRPVVIAGDFNADQARTEFKDDTVFPDLENAGFDDLLLLLPRALRTTYPSTRFGNSAIDHICVRGFAAVAAPKILPAGELSDHNPVFVLVSVK